MNSPQALPGSGGVNISGNSTLALNYTDNGPTTYTGTINIQAGAEGINSRPTINVPSGTVTVNGDLRANCRRHCPDRLDEDRGRHLLLTNAQGSTRRLRHRRTSTAASSRSNSTYGLRWRGILLGAGQRSLTVASRPASGGGLWLNNVQMGVNQNQTTGPTTRFLRHVHRRCPQGHGYGCGSGAGPTWPQS